MPNKLCVTLEANPGPTLPFPSFQVQAASRSYGLPLRKGAPLRFGAPTSPFPATPPCSGRKQ
ncbi:hypothetical protein AMTR_s04985p00002830, partial [Amborella trichopoda]